MVFTLTKTTVHRRHFNPQRLGRHIGFCVIVRTTVRDTARHETDRAGSTQRTQTQTSSRFEANIPVDCLIQGAIVHNEVTTGHSIDITKVRGYDCVLTVCQVGTGQQTDMPGRID